jgi:hypothetical protein
LFCIFQVLLWSFVRRVWRYQRGNQNPYIEEEQATQWPKERVQKDKQRSTKHTHKTKDRVTRTPLKTEDELGCSPKDKQFLPILRELILGNRWTMQYKPQFLVESLYAMHFQNCIRWYVQPNNMTAVTRNQIQWYIKKNPLQIGKHFYSFYMELMMISIFPLLNFHLYVPTFQQHLHMKYISLSWSDIPELVVITGPRVPCGQRRSHTEARVHVHQHRFHKKYK